MSMDPETQQDWKVRYAAKLARPEEAIRLIPARKRILIGSGAAEPSRLVEAMVAHGTHLEGNEVVHLMTLPGKIVTSFVMGTRRLYEWVPDNPQIEMRPSGFTNDPVQIARNDQMVAINSALAVDLTGQVAADTVRGRFFSGIGGQVDFIRGAARSKGGRPIIALPATARAGTVSRIQPIFEEGTGVVTSRGDIHYVVTEYGIADLWGRTIRQRTEA